MAVVDASVYVALINGSDRHHTAGWAWFEQIQTTGEALVAPATVLSEVAAALSRGVGDVKLAHRVVRQFKNSGAVELVAVTSDLAERAAIVAAEYRIRGCDAVYVALADLLSDCLVTLDQQQLERAAAIVVTRRP